MSSTRVAEYLKTRARQMEISTAELSRRSQLSRQTVHRLLTADIAQAKIDTIVKISHALQLEPTDVMGIYFGRTIRTERQLH